jgi:alpha-aminoadipate/glutamate carrier protein LysW
MTECPVCGVGIEAKESMVQNELISCSECGTELEVTNLSPFELKEAPQEEEDWGE